MKNASKWEIAERIARKLNKLLERDDFYRRYIEPEDILAKRDSKADLLFYYDKMCVRRNENGEVY